MNSGDILEPPSAQGEIGEEHQPEDSPLGPTAGNHFSVELLNTDFEHDEDIES
jgi:hypothetical protein